MDDQQHGAAGQQLERSIVNNLEAEGPEVATVSQASPVSSLILETGALRFAVSFCVFAEAPLPLACNLP